MANLKPFKKGQSGNPKGKEPGTVSIVAGIKRKLLEVEPENKRTYLDLFLSKYFRKAIRDGDVNLIRDMINRVDGMPNQKTELDATVAVVNIIDYSRKKDGGNNTTSQL